MPFQYLSFQRPPPAQVRPGEKIAIAPLITNDLRDETFSPEESDAIVIHVAWVCLKKKEGYSHSENDGSGAQDAYYQPPVQLSIVKWEDSISWTGVECSWKIFTVVSPAADDLERAGITSGSPRASLRLALWVDQSSVSQNSRSHKRAKRSGEKARAASPAALIDQISIDPVKASAASHAGEVVFVGVTTPAIELKDDKRPVCNEKFSEHCRLVKVVIPQKEDAFVEITEQNGYELDKHIWDASFPLKSLLVTGKTVSPAHDDEGIRLLKAVKDAIADSTNDLLVLELGSGTGSLSVYLHSMLRFTATPASQRNVQIVATDLENSVDFTRSNILLNGLGERSPQAGKGDTYAAAEDTEMELTHPSLRISTMPLDWYSKKLPARLTDFLNRNGPSINLLILASDCSYNPDTYDAFASLLVNLFAAASGEVCCLLSKKHRHVDEKSLWHALESREFRGHLIDGRHYRYSSNEGNSTASDDEDAIGRWGIFAIDKSS